MTENNQCPCCGRHCDLNEPHCERGREYARTGVIPERTEGHEEHGEHDAHGEYGRYRSRGELGDHRSCGVNGENGGHRTHRDRGESGGHQCHRGRGENGVQSSDRDQYEGMDVNAKLVVNLRELGHMNRFLFEGKGSQKRILTILNESGSMTQRNLTERIGIQPGSASEVIGKLEIAGFIQRVPSETDRRTTDIHLTEEGKIQAEEAEVQRQERCQEMFACLSEDEKNTLLELFEKLNADWNSRFHEFRKERGPHGRHGRFTKKDDNKLYSSPLHQH